MQPLVSIIIPVYNVEKYFDKCIASVLNQTYTNLQILLIDDGSTDKSGIMCDQYAVSDNRIYVIHKQNGGLSDARNYGLDLVKGEYIAFIDSDDYVECQYIDKLLHAALENNVDLVMCNFTCVDNDYEEIEWQPGHSSENLKGLITPDNTMISLSNPSGGFYVVMWNKLYKTVLFNDIRFPLRKIHEDQFVIHRILNRCNAVYCITDSLYYYVQRNNSITAMEYSTKNLDVMDAFLDRARFYQITGKYNLVKLSYKQYINEYAKACKFLNKKNNNVGIYKKYLKENFKVIFLYTDIFILLRYIAVTWFPSLYYFILQRPWRKNNKQ